MTLLACKSFLLIDLAHFNTLFLFSFTEHEVTYAGGCLKFAVFKQELGVDGVIIDIVSFTIQIRFLPVFLVVAGFLIDLASALLFHGWRGVLSPGCDITGSLVCGMRDDVSFRALCTSKSVTVWFVICC